MKLNSKKRNASILIVGGIIATFCSWDFQDDYPSIVARLVFGGGLLMIGAGSFINSGIISQLEKEIAKQQKQSDIK